MEKGSKQDCNWVWIKSEPAKRKYRQQMKKKWDETGVFSVTEQRLPISRSS